MNTTFLAGIAALLLPVIGLAGEYSLTVDRVKIDTGDFVKTGIGYNGKSPGPVLRFREGEEVSINVTNNLDEMTSIHWHGLILPFDQDGMPGISFPGIKPGETFTCRFSIRQAGIYRFRGLVSTETGLGLSYGLIDHVFSPSVGVVARKTAFRLHFDVR